MEGNATSLQDKIQRLIDQYTKDKAKLELLDKQNADLKEENRQLMEQISSINANESSSMGRIAELEAQIEGLKKAKHELQETIAGFELIATDAIGKIDKVIPNMGSGA